MSSTKKTDVSFWSLPRAYDVNDEDAHSFDTGKYDQRKIKPICPGCDKPFAALCSKNTTHTDSGWRWAGCDHREPYATFVTRHRCGTEFVFTVYTPQ